MIAPLYARVYDGLRAQIEGGDLPVGARLPTQNVLADRFDVSVITVKHALELLQRAGYVERRPRIGAVVVSTQPSPAPARRLPTIGCIVTDFDDSFGTRLLHGLLDASVGHANVVLARTEGHHDREQRLLAQFQELDVDGLVLLPGSSDWIAPAVLDLVHRERPLVVLDRALTGLPISTVCSDNVGSGRLAAEYLFDLGHRHIALVTSSGQVSSLDDRHAGFVYAHAARGYTFDATHEFRDVRSTVPNAPHEVSDDVAALKRFLVDHPQVTGVVGGEYSVSLLVRRACLELGRSVPGDVSIVSIDSPDNTYDDARQAFTHVAQDEPDLGRTALDTVIAQIASPASVTKHVLPTRLVVGDTTAPLGEGTTVSPGAPTAP